MAKVTPGYQLYLYQLLSREIGVGRQTLLPQVEEALAKDDILPEDLECATIQEVVEACPDFLKLTVFKKGRAYATVVRNEEWDKALAEPAEKQAKKAPAAKAKSWKSKKKGAKGVSKPVKPGKQRRDREAAESAAAEEQARLAAEAEEQARLAAEAAQLAEGAQAGEPAEEVVQAQTITEEAAPQEGPGDADAPQDTDEAEADAVTPSADEPPAPITVGSEASGISLTITYTPEPKTVAETEPVAPTEPQPEPQLPAEQQQEGESAVAPAQEPPIAPAPEPISLTITYDPRTDGQDKAEVEPAADIEPAAAPAPAPQQTPAPAPSPVSLRDLPQRFGEEVSCADALMRALYQLLPFDAEPMAVLDEDWRVARATGTLSGTRGRVSFPLRYLHEDGTPIEVTLRRSSRNASGRRWSLALVDGDDGTGAGREMIGFDVLPTADEGAWADLSGTRGSVSASPVRELAQQVVIGTWEGLLGSLAALAAPERWNFPGEGVGKTSRYGILREYVAVTFHRARAQERVACSADGSFAALNTGLLTAFGEDIYLCLSARNGDIPWKFAGFANAGSGELGARLASTVAELPEAPTYLESLEDVVARQGRMVILDTEAILGDQLGRLPRAFLDEQVEGNFAAEALLSAGPSLTAAELRDLARVIRSDAGAYRRMRRTLDDAVDQAMLRVRESYRDAVPVFDPADDRTKLLVPLCLVRDGHADCALVLDLQPSGAYRAAQVLSLPRAYACARVVSREQPSWLSAERVL